jgi:hypothetical protein
MPPPRRRRRRRTAAAAAATAAVASSESVLAKHFEASAKRGIVLSARQLADYARRRGLQSVPLKTLRQMRHRFKFTALSSRHVRPPRYASSSIMTYGAVQVDAAWMFKKRASVNGGAVGFLLGVEGVSGQLAVQPMKDLTSKSWEKALRQMVETSAFSSVRTFMSDRDSAVKSNDESEGLRGKLKRDFGISWYFMRGRHKAARAERMIRWVKESLSTAERAVGDGRWVVNLQGLVSEYNSRVIPGTDVVRKDVNKNNYVRLLEKKYKSDSPTSLMNLANLPENSSLARFVWKFKVGDAVLLARRVSDDLKKRIFDKASVVGTYSPKVYRVSGRHTKLNSGLFLCALYSLEGLPGKYYQTDLSAASFEPPLTRQRRRRLQARADAETTT